MSILLERFKSESKSTVFHLICKYNNALEMKGIKSREITLLVAILAGMILFIWGDLFLGKHEICLYHSWFGIPCPFCGLTRAVYELMHLRIVSAWNFNPLVFLLMIWFIAELAYVILPIRNHLSVFLKVLRFVILGSVLLLLLIRCFKYFPLP